MVIYYKLCHHGLVQNSYTAMLTATPGTEVALKVAVVPVPILDHLSTLTACLGLAIKGKLLNLALNGLSLAHLQA